MMYTNLIQKNVHSIYTDPAYWSVKNTKELSGKKRTAHNKFLGTQDSRDA